MDIKKKHEKITLCSIKYIVSDVKDIPTVGNNFYFRKTWYKITSVGTTTTHDSYFEGEKLVTTKTTKVTLLLSS